MTKQRPLFGRRMILKIQRPLFGDPVALAYNRSRKVLFHLSMDEGFWKLFGDREKVYVHARVSGAGIEVISEAPEQPW